MSIQKYASQLQRVVEFVKKETTGNDSQEWVTVKYRDLPKIAGATNYSVRRVMEGLRLHPHIMYEVLESGKGNRRAMKYKYIEDPEIKKHAGFSAKNFYHLNQSEIDYILSKIDYLEYEQQSHLLTVINAIANEGGKEYYGELVPKKYSEMLMLAESEVQWAFDKLNETKLLIQVDQYSKLVLADGAYEEEEKAIDNNTYQIKQAKEPKKSSKDLSDLQDTPAQSQPEETFKENSNNQAGFTESFVEKDNPQEEFDENECIPTFSDLIDSQKSMKQTIQEFMRFWEHQESLLLNKHQLLQTQEKELQSGYEALNKIITEQNGDKERLYKLQKENDQFKKALERKTAFAAAFVQNAQSALDDLLGEVITSIVDYSRLPNFRRSEKTDNALKANIAASIQKANLEILSFKND